MTTATATTCIWELGIDWNAIETEGKSYMRQGFVNQEGLIDQALVKPGDTITFRIFDVSSDATSPEVAGIESFVILSRAAVSQPSDNLLSSLQPTITMNPDPITATSTVFGNTALRSWTSQQPVSVNDTLETQRFLLSFQAQAHGLANGSSRIFGHDPEMIVGPNGG
jgi:hypothetical protein